MAISIVVEDGSIVSGANSYGTLAEANAYFANEAETAWTASTVTDNMKNVALLRAMGYIEALNWKGTTVSGVDQPLQWPRQDVYDRDNNLLEEDYIPPNVKKAQFEAAVLVLGTGNRKELEPDLYRDNKVISSSVGGSISTIYRKTAPSETVRYKIKNLLKGLLKSESNIEIIRA